MYLSRGKLFEKVLGRELKELADLSELREKGTVGFQGFQSSFNAEDVTAYIQLVQTLSGFAENNKHISPKEVDMSNEKFQMRTWLVRAGMIGESYKYARKLFTQNLTGNSAWLNLTETAVAEEIGEARETEEQAEKSEERNTVEETATEECGNDCDGPKMNL